MMMMMKTLISVEIIKLPLNCVQAKYSCIHSRLQITLTEISRLCTEYCDSILKYRNTDFSSILLNSQVINILNVISYCIISQIEKTSRLFGNDDTDGR
jgi:hypothetical protein